MIQFILNNEHIQTDVHDGVTLLDFIRDYKLLKGTKVGCREGDCGACTVLVGTLKDDTVSYHSITSCISPLGNANNKHIVTVEGTNIPNTLNTTQQTLSDNYATQCGFCTPGFAVSMTGYAINTTKDTPSSCNDAISGNICRCTGYKSIEKAGVQIEEKIKNIDENNRIGWLIEQGFIPNYFETIPAQLKELSSKGVHVEFNRVKNATIVANGTDVYVREADRLIEEPVRLISEEQTLKGIYFTDATCTIGVNTTVTEILENNTLQSIFPKISSFLKLVSSEQIRNMGTLGGNFVNASPIGDMSVFFLALNSTLRIEDIDGNERQIPFQEFHHDYKKYDLQEDELLKNISFTLPDEHTSFNFEKVSKRTHLDIASVNSAIRITVNKNTIKDIHFSLGGVAAIPKFLNKTIDYLKGKEINSDTILNAERIVQSEITPISDVRGTSDYKRLLARQLFFTHFITMYPDQIDIQKLISL